MTTRRAMLALLAAACAARAFGQAPRRVDLRVIGGAVGPEQRVIKAVRGETLVLRVTSDKAGALHLHGYDIELALAAGAPAEALVTARAAGRFAAYFHPQGEAASKRHGPALFHLDVLPK